MGTIDRLIEYHRALAESEAALAKSLSAQAGIEARRDRRAGDADFGAGLEAAAKKNEARAQLSDVTANCLTLLRDLAYPPAPERLHPDRPKKVFTGHLKRPEDTSAGLRFPP